MDYKTRADLNSVEKIYWFLRYLVETDKGAFAKHTDKLNNLSESLGATLTAVRNETDETQIDVLNGVLRDSVLSGFKDGTQQFQKVSSLVRSLQEILTAPNDFKSFVFCLNNILLPSNQALDLVPTQEATKIAGIYAKNLLDAKGASGLGNILTEWDSITLDICLNRERDICSKLFRDVRANLDGNLDFLIEEKDGEPNNQDIVLSSLIQEFERRLGQKRKQRSGQDLEDATTFIFNHFGIPCADGPSHFTASIEVDNWVKDKKGWYIGFSLKRTLRERWKQTVVDKDTLTEFKIRYIVHLICNDGDLTDAKIGDMGAKRHLFFVPDSSEILTRVEDDNVLAEYVRPMSTLIDCLKTC